MSSMESNEERSFVNVGNSLSDEFSICNGMGSFILEDDTQTYSSSEKLSFVVLQSAVASYIDIEQKNEPIDSSSLVESLNSSEVHEKLSELLQENAKLKETLKQNNVAMKQQYSTLASWQEKMMKVYDDHKKKFAETRELIHHLKEENAELKTRVAVEGVSRIPLHEMPSTCEMQSNNMFSILDMSLEEIEELSNSRQLSVQENLLSMAKGDEKTQVASTMQTPIDMLGKETPTLQSFVSNYISQSITKNTPEHAEAVDTCTDCVKCLKKDEEIDTLKELLIKLEHELQSASICENRILHNALRSQEMYVLYLETQVQKYKEYTTLYKTQLALYEEDFQLERQQKNILREENNQIHEDLIKTMSSLTED